MDKKNLVKLISKSFVNRVKKDKYFIFMNTETSLDTEIVNNSNNLELKFVALSVEKAIKIVAVDDIVYLESSGRYTTLYFNNNSNITCTPSPSSSQIVPNNH